MFAYWVTLYIQDMLIYIQVYNFISNILQYTRIHNFINVWSLVRFITVFSELLWKCFLFAHTPYWITDKR